MIADRAGHLDRVRSFLVRAANKVYRVFSLFSDKPRMFVFWPMVYMRGMLTTWHRYRVFFSTRPHTCICLARYMLSPRPSVCHTGISQKRLTLGSCNIHHRVGPPVYFLQDKFNPEMLTGSHLAGASNEDRVGKHAIFLPYVPIYRKRYEIVQSYY